MQSSSIHEKIRKANGEEPVIQEERSLKKLTADMHMHTFVSGHAYGTMREMAQAASEKGLEMIGITEHAPGIQGTVHPFYFLNFEVVPRQLCGVEVYHGSEVNVMNDGTLSLEQRYLEELDYAIAGIHLNCYENEGREKNTQNLISCMKHEKVKIVSHPDDDHTPLDYEALVQAAKEYHVALEVNNSSLVKPERRWNCYENYRTMLRLCRKYQVPVIADSDAHDPSWVGRLDLACKLLEEEGMPDELILNTDAQKVKDFIGYDLPAKL